MPPSRPCEGTFWKYSINAIQLGKPRNIIFAAVKAIDVGPKVKIVAWELNIRSWG